MSWASTSKPIRSSRMILAIEVVIRELSLPQSNMVSWGGASWTCYFENFWCVLNGIGMQYFLLRTSASHVEPLRSHEYVASLTGKPSTTALRSDWASAKHVAATYRINARATATSHGDEHQLGTAKCELSLFHMTWSQCRTTG
eukprot:6468032-Amphidinium_carterae.1